MRLRAFVGVSTFTPNVLISVLGGAVDNEFR
jgi:hypothetical protein